MTLADSRTIELDVWKKLEQMNDKIGVVLQEFQNLPPELINSKDNDRRPELGRLVYTIIEQLADLEVKFGESRKANATLTIKKTQNKSKKRPVEKRITKDRKIRYVPIPKLSNFYPAAPETIAWTHERRNELFKSVFQY
ncbi:TRAUB domain-containing protein [Aphelenchoides besseyi]|nr:TRAUB domain-containing protein [Aphelenchoides besseyi]KAI6208100.1 TRAUB domain-containing protein [Aphelenchoides besseyi]